MQVLCFSLVLSIKKFSPQSQVKNWDELWLNVVYLEAQLIDSFITKPSSNTILNNHSDKIMVRSSPTSLYMNSKINITKSNTVQPWFRSAKHLQCRLLWKMWMILVLIFGSDQALLSNVNISFLVLFSIENKKDQVFWERAYH